MEISRRELFAHGGRLSVLAGLAMVAVPALDACSATTTGGTGTASGSRTLIIGINGDIETRDPFKADNPNADEVSDFNIYDQYFDFGSKASSVAGIPTYDLNNLQGLTVNRWQLAPDQSYIDLFVRPGMKFHRTGNPVTADDVAFMLNRCKATSGSGPGAFYQLANIESFKKTGPMSVRINFSKPSPWFFQLFFQDNMGLYDSKDVLAHATSSDEFGSSYIAKTDVASGPYQVGQYVPGSHITLQAFPDYWRGKPYFDTVQVQFLGSDSERVSFLEKGSIQIAEELSADSLQSLQGVSGVKVINVPSRNQAIMGLNVTEPPFNNETLRKALAYAIPYQDIVTQAWKGNAQVSKGVIPLLGAYHDSSTYPWTYDPAKAKSLLSQAGHPTGFSFTVIYENGSSTDQQMLVYLQTRLREVGIQMSLNGMTAAAYATAQNTLSARQAWYEEIIWFVDNPGYIGNFFGNSKTFLTPTGYSNPTLDKVVQGMDFVVTNTEEQAKMQQLATEYQNILNGAAVFMTLGDLNHQLAMRSNISGWKLYPNLETRYWLLR